MPEGLMQRALTALVFIVTLALLGGCASTRLVDSEVTSFARWTPAPPAPGANYRFERLPSQQSDAQQQQLESLAQAALAKVGLQHNPSAATLSVQVSASTLPVLRPSWDGGYAAYPYGGPNIFIGGGLGGGMERPLYRRELSIVMRELRSNAVVYETRASSEALWQDNTPVLAAMFDAALRGFPVPPAGPRRISIEMPK
ncbi:DUF4136 domain-containing protein [Polaromonas sp. SM01]|uniref:DUF4136 domain-containing protein n=1 Tax=Polaromonas sp. SM01 TaxID=3085630 RepID=UPI0029827BA2|nr:DUF4136 domain-containing protein [Polaromonas sp. SM01]MDW5445108.1 DUF4136 domain-containing protein [Polaromonas sp. SM01]